MRAKGVSGPRQPASSSESRVARCSLAAFKSGGGYVFNNVHNIQNGFPPENVVALFDAAHELDSYALKD